MGKGWRPTRMINNAERTRPLGDDPASDAVEDARGTRELTGLDEGRAWRHRDGGLVVVRSEVYADEVPGAAASHRAAWHEHAERSLDATWRERWRERDREPGWIEARWVWSGTASDAEGVAGSGGEMADGSEVAGSAPTLSAACDWVRIEDHTASAGAARSAGDGAVTVYEHVTVWHGRRQVTVVTRHDVGLDLDDLAVRCANEVELRLYLAGT